ncbi:nucleotidyltransferase domain-containing protein [Consotaella aegiceratis]|uniref:nucleotidyltransferase domain-containing protein n=1 Tax=Consotaella aegiceratis TaxID=3097961 RepID=UPI002F420AC0
MAGRGTEHPPRKDDETDALASALAAAFGAMPEVVAVALGGSRATGTADATSDIDLYVYSDTEVPVAGRTALIAPRSSRREIDNRFWETGDEWTEAASGLHVDVMYRTRVWTEEQLDRVLDRHEPQIGYSTCIWHNIATARPLFDRTGWFATLQDRAGQPYPDALARAIVARNRPLLSGSFSAFRDQMIKAATRGDRVSVNHRTAAFLASYFDVLFAANRALHPGEKRLVDAAAALPRVPAGMANHIQELLAADGSPARIAACADALCSGLDTVLAGTTLPA